MRSLLNRQIVCVCMCVAVVGGGSQARWTTGAKAEKPTRGNKNKETVSNSVWWEQRVCVRESQEICLDRQSGARPQRAFTSVKESGLYTLYTVVRQWRIFRRKVIQSDLTFWGTARVKWEDGKTEGRRLQWSRRKWQEREPCWTEWLHVRLSQGDPEATGSRGPQDRNSLDIYFFWQGAPQKSHHPRNIWTGFYMRVT